MAAGINAFGAFLKKKRLELDLTLRAFCHENGFDVGNTSKIERGLMDPPKTPAVLEQYARALKLKPGSQDWEAFFELAAISAGRIPDRILDDRELLAKLPLVFRTTSGQSLSEEKLRELVDLIRNA
ncbi:MAG: helix-turn-helix transcriptional regulator [Planctomycetes bacterium]|nr:helix-turn-helix transcriptional regulator [Planctomycetota bacterium]